MRRIIRSPESKEDVLEIGRYIARGNMDAALAMLDEFDRVLKLLAEFPGMGPAREELGQGLRSFPVGKYLIFYREAPRGIEVIRVLHGARNLRRIFKRRRKQN